MYESALAGRGVAGLRILLDRAVAAVSNGIIITDPNLPDDPIIYVNPAFERTTGYSREEVVGRNCRFLQGEDREQPALKELRAALREGRECRVVLRNYRKSGEMFYNELYISPVHDEGGRVTNFIGVQNDITARRQAQERLKESEEHFRATFDQAAVGMAHVALNGRWMRVNDRLCEITGYTREELLRKTFQEITHPEDFGRQAGLVRKMLAGEVSTYSLEKRYIRRDGSPVWVNVTVSLLHEESGEPRYFITLVEDISKRKQAEEERDLLLVREQLVRAEAVKARKRFALLAAAGPVLAASLDYEATLERISRIAIPDLADWCLVDMVEDGGAVSQQAASHADPAKEPLLRELAAHRTFDEEALCWGPVRALRDGRPVLEPEITDQVLVRRATSAGHLRLLQRLAPRSVMSVPLLARGRVLGAMTFVSSNVERLYDEEDLSLAESLAYRCALAVDNARLYSDRSHIARTLQRSLLPHLPEVPGVEVGVEYLPVGEGIEVGGDFYDLVESGDEAGWLAVIGDVCGKGAEATAVTALVRYTIQAIAVRERDPARVLRFLNEAMKRQVPEEQFATVACGRLTRNGSGWNLVVGRGGHLPPLVLRASGDIEYVNPPGRVLGIFKDPEVETETVHLGPGDAAVFYTDGIIEARAPEGFMFGEERLRGLLRACAGMDATSLARRLRDAVLEFEEGVPRDDFAILVLRVPE